MAAVLCGGICSAFTGLCEGLGKICSAPCKLANRSGPFCIYVTVALGLNLPQIVLALISISRFPCLSTTWLVVNALFCTVNIVAAIYLAFSIMDPNKANLQDRKSAVSRASHMLCHDPWIAVYMLMCIGFFVWSIVGSSWDYNDKAKNGEKCNRVTLSRFQTSIGFNYAFMFIGFFALSISCCCACCYQQTLNRTEQPPQEQPQPSVDVETPLVNAVPVNAVPIYEATAPSATPIYEKYEPATPPPQPSAPPQQPSAAPQPSAPPADDSTQNPDSLASKAEKIMGKGVNKANDLFQRYTKK